MTSVNSTKSKYMGMGSSLAINMGSSLAIIRSFDEILVCGTLIYFANLFLLYLFYKSLFPTKKEQKQS